jgi:DNA modification methylase
MTVRYLIGDVFDRLRELPDESVDLLCTSPPFLALRNYLPADHPDKGKEIGSEATPADFIDTLLALTAEWGRVLAPHGSICVELGDTYSGSGGAGGDYNDGGMRDGQGKFDGSASRLRTRKRTDGGQYGNHQGADTKYNEAVDRPIKPSRGWPLAKSLTGIPTLYPWSLAYGRNLLRTPMTAHEALEWVDRLRAHGWTAEQALTAVGSWTAEHGDQHRFTPWRIRNVIVWARPNPPVGALGDKFRPATSYITVACKGPRRYFDLDAVRQPPGNGQRNSPKDWTNAGVAHWGTRERAGYAGMHTPANDHEGSDQTRLQSHPAGAPPLDWHADDHPEAGDWLWKLSTQPYKGSHYAAFPLELPRRLILAMCPQRVCTVCGKPSERITERTPEYAAIREAVGDFNHRADGQGSSGPRTQQMGRLTAAENVTLGWSDCGHDAWRPGVVLDPFGGSGTTGAAAASVGRDAWLIDLDARNAELAVERCGMFMETVDAGTPFVPPPSLF